MGGDHVETEAIFTGGQRDLTVGTTGAYHCSRSVANMTVLVMQLFGEWSAQWLIEVRAGCVGTR